MDEQGNVVGAEYRLLWRQFQFFLEEELESAYFNALFYYQHADVSLTEGRKSEAHRHLLDARTCLGRAQGLRDVLGTMRLREQQQGSKRAEELQGSGATVVRLFPKRD